MYLCSLICFLRTLKISNSGGYNSRVSHLPTKTNITESLILGKSDAAEFAEIVLLLSYTHLNDSAERTSDANYCTQQIAYEVKLTILKIEWRRGNVRTYEPDAYNRRHHTYTIIIYLNIYITIQNIQQRVTKYEKNVPISASGRRF